MTAVFWSQIHFSTLVVLFSAVISNGLSRYPKILSLISGGRSEKVTGCLSGCLSGLVDLAGTIVTASSEARLPAELVPVVSSGTAKVCGVIDTGDILLG